MLKKILFGLIFISSLSFANEEGTIYHFFEAPHSLENYDTPMFSYKINTSTPYIIEEYSPFFARIEINFNDKKNPYPELLLYEPRKTLYCNYEGFNEVYDAQIMHSKNIKTKVDLKIKSTCEERYDDDRKTKTMQLVFSGYTQKDHEIFSNTLKQSIGSSELKFDNKLFSIQTNGYTKALKNKTTPREATSTVRHVFAPEIANGIFYREALSSFSIKDNNSFDIDTFLLKIELLERNNKYVPVFRYWNHLDYNTPLKCNNEDIVKSQIYYTCDTNICSEQITFKKQCETVEQNGEKYYTVVLAPSIEDEDTLINHFKEGTTSHIKLFKLFTETMSDVYFSTEGYNEETKYLENNKHH